MAAPKKSTAEEAISLLPDGPNPARPRLHKLIVKNFRGISSNAIEIELDEIVVLVGPNNVGKSSILRAYEIVMKQGSNEGKLQLEDFPNSIVNQENLPEIELQTIIFTNAPGARWIHKTEQDELLIREKWTWNSPNTNPQRCGFDVQKNAWDDQVPWGAPSVANTRRPVPHRIEAFASPDTQAKEIADLLINILKEKLKSTKSTADTEDKLDYAKLIESIGLLQKTVVASAKEEIERIEGDISSLLAKVFPKHQIKLDAKPETDVEKAFTPFKASPDLLMGPSDGYLSKVSQQGSGARRTLLWTALKYLADSKSGNADSARPNVLLLDEPEICLHPSAIREARKVLYDLPKSKNWQVMITTHSPIFIDLSKDNTTVVRVERNADNSVLGTTLYRPSRSKLDDNDRANLKALNACDPYVNEFFFGNKSVVVEGDTEFTSFSLVKDLNPDKYHDLHIIRARGKGIIITLLKILNQFSSTYGVLHDSDTPMGKKGANPAWGMNRSILEKVLESSTPNGIKHIACIRNFEDSIFDEDAKADKPYNALTKISDNPTLQAKVCKLLDALIDNAIEPPDDCVRWNSIDDLEKLVNAKQSA
jgi:putative ATP-dependent endonuclease of the OLD family